MDSGQLQSFNKYGSDGVPFAGQIAEIEPPEQQIQQIIDALAPVAQAIIDALVPIIETCADTIRRLWEALLKSYPDKRVVHLAFYHKKARVRKKNRNRIARYIQKAVMRDD